MIKKLKDPVSGLSHLLGALLSILALIILINYAPLHGTYVNLVAFSIFGASLILLYSASAIYHLIPVEGKASTALRTIDHMAIYVLIAGTYTPICLIVLHGIWRWGLLIGIWSIALVGILLKIFWFGAPRWLSTSFYIFMGWLVIIAFFPLIKSMPYGGILWMVYGGIFYSVGGVVYGTKWSPVQTKYFGFHEVFHLFVLAGSFSHFWMMLKYV